MKLNSTYDNAVLESSCDLDGTTFRIKACPEAFKILTDNLYNDKIGTIVRELSCNAYDSQVQNGNPEQPFDIFIPDKLYPIFYIRDYGTGLTKEEIRHIYTTYFESTKSTSNDYIGAFGLGSKTPLAYTDQFTVTSYKDGMEYAYRVYTSDKGFPEIQLVIEKETKEPNGLKVQISVEYNDIEEFRTNIKKFFAYNHIKPNFINVQIEPKLNVVYTYKNLSYLEDTYDYQTTYLARIGMVVYPIPRFYVEDIKNYLPDNSYSNNFNEFLYYMINNLTYGKKILIDFNIGDLAVTASRESLSMDKATKEKLYTTLANLFLDMYNTCHKDITKVQTIEEIIDLVEVYPLAIYKKVFYCIPDDINDGYITYNDLSLKLTFAFHREIEQTFNNTVALNYCSAKSGFRYNFSKYEFYCSLRGNDIFTIKIGNLTKSQIREINLPGRKDFTYIKVKTKEEAEKIKEYIENKFPKKLFQVDVNFIEKEEKPKKVYDKSKATPVINNLIYFNLKDRYYITNSGSAKDLLTEDETVYFLPKTYPAAHYKDLLTFYRPDISRVFLITHTQERILTRLGYKLECLQNYSSDFYKDKYNRRVRVAHLIYNVLTNFQREYKSLANKLNINEVLNKLQPWKSFDYLSYNYWKAEALKDRILKYYDNQLSDILTNNLKQRDIVSKMILTEAFYSGSSKRYALENNFRKSFKIVEKSINDFLKL